MDDSLYCVLPRSAAIHHGVKTCLTTVSCDFRSVLLYFIGQDIAGVKIGGARLTIVTSMVMTTTSQVLGCIVGFARDITPYWRTHVFCQRHLQTGSITGRHKAPGLRFCFP